MYASIEIWWFGLDHYTIFPLYRCFHSGKKLEGSTCRVVLAASPNLENLGKKPSKIFQSHFEASNDFVFGHNCYLWRKIPYYTLWDLSNGVSSDSISVCMKNLCLAQFDLLCWPQWYERMPHQCSLLTHTGLFIWVLSRIL